MTRTRNRNSILSTLASTKDCPPADGKPVKSRVSVVRDSGNIILDPSPPASVGEASVVKRTSEHAEGDASREAARAALLAILEGPPVASQVPSRSARSRGSEIRVKGKYEVDGVRSSDEAATSATAQQRWTEVEVFGLLLYRNKPFMRLLVMEMRKILADLGLDDRGKQRELRLRLAERLLSDIADGNPGLAALQGFDHPEPPDGRQTEASDAQTAREMRRERRRTTTVMRKINVETKDNPILIPSSDDEGSIIESTTGGIPATAALRINRAAREEETCISSVSGTSSQMGLTVEQLNTLAAGPDPKMTMAELRHALKILGLKCKGSKKNDLMACWYDAAVAERKRVAEELCVGDVRVADMTVSILKKHLEDMDLKPASKLKADLQQCLCEALVRNGVKGKSSNEVSENGQENDCQTPQELVVLETAQIPLSPQTPPSARVKGDNQVRHESGTRLVYEDTLPDSVRCEEHRSSVSDAGRDEEGAQAVPHAPKQEDVTHGLVEALIQRRAEAAEKDINKQAWGGRRLKAMRKAELIGALSDLGADTSGKVDDMRKRLRKELWKWASSEVVVPPVETEAEARATHSTFEDTAIGDLDTEGGVKGETVAVCASANEADVEPEEDSSGELEKRATVCGRDAAIHGTIASFMNQGHSHGTSLPTGGLATRCGDGGGGSGEISSEEEDPNQTPEDREDEIAGVNRSPQNLSTGFGETICSAVGNTLAHDSTSYDSEPLSSSPCCAAEHAERIALDKDGVPTGVGSAPLEETPMAGASDTPSDASLPGQPGEAADGTGTDMGEHGFADDRDSGEGKGDGSGSNGDGGSGSGGGGGGGGDGGDDDDNDDGNDDGSPSDGDGDSEDDDSLDQEQDGDEEDEDNYEEVDGDGDVGSETEDVAIVQEVVEVSEVHEKDAPEPIVARAPEPGREDDTESSLGAAPESGVHASSEPEPNVALALEPNLAPEPESRSVAEPEPSVAFDPEANVTLKMDPETASEPDPTTASLPGPASDPNPEDEEDDTERGETFNCSDQLAPGGNYMDVEWRENTEGENGRLGTEVEGGEKEGGDMDVQGADEASPDDAPCAEAGVHLAPDVASIVDAGEANANLAGMDVEEGASIPPDVSSSSDNVRDPNATSENCPQAQVSRLTVPHAGSRGGGSEGRSMEQQNAPEVVEHDEGDAGDDQEGQTLNEQHMIHDEEEEEHEEQGRHNAVQNAQAQVQDQDLLRHGEDEGGNGNEQALDDGEDADGGEVHDEEDEDGGEVHDEEDEDGGEVHDEDEEVDTRGEIGDDEEIDEEEDDDDEEEEVDEEDEEEDDEEDDEEEDEEDDEEDEEDDEEQELRETDRGATAISSAHYSGVIDLAESSDEEPMTADRGRDGDRQSDLSAAEGLPSPDIAFLVRAGDEVDDDHHAVRSEAAGTSSLPLPDRHLLGISSSAGVSTSAPVPPHGPATVTASRSATIPYMPETHERDERTNSEVMSEQAMSVDNFTRQDMTPRPVHVEASLDDSPCPMGTSPQSLPSPVADEGGASTDVAVATSAAAATATSPATSATSATTSAATSAATTAAAASESPPATATARAPKMNGKKARGVDPEDGKEELKALLDDKEFCQEELSKMLSDPSAKSVESLVPSLFAPGTEGVERSVSSRDDSKVAELVSAFFPSSERLKDHLGISVVQPNAYRSAAAASAAAGDDGRRPRIRDGPQSSRSRSVTHSPDDPLSVDVTPRSTRGNVGSGKAANENLPGLKQGGSRSGVELGKSSDQNWAKSGNLSPEARTRDERGGANQRPVSGLVWPSTPVLSRRPVGRTPLGGGQGGLNRDRYRRTSCSTLRYRTRDLTPRKRARPLMSDQLESGAGTLSDWFRGEGSLSSSIRRGVKNPSSDGNVDRREGAGADMSVDAGRSTGAADHDGMGISAMAVDSSSTSVILGDSEVEGNDPKRRRFSSEEAAREARRTAAERKATEEVGSLLMEIVGQAPASPGASLAETREQQRRKQKEEEDLLRKGGNMSKGVEEEKQSEEVGKSDGRKEGLEEERKVSSPRRASQLPRAPHGGEQESTAPKTAPASTTSAIGIGPRHALVESSGSRDYVFAPAEVAEVHPILSGGEIPVVENDFAFTYKRVFRPKQQFTFSSGRSENDGLPTCAQLEALVAQGSDGQQVENEDPDQFQFSRNARPKHRVIRCRKDLRKGKVVEKDSSRGAGLESILPVAPSAEAGSPSSDGAAKAKAPVANGFDMSKFRKPGQWKCNVCLVQNDADVSKCPACETPRPGGTTSAVTTIASTPSSTITGSGSSTSGAPSAAPITITTGFDMSKFRKPGQWKCNACFVMNDSSASKCVACETPRAGGSEAPTGSSSGGAGSGAPSGIFGTSSLLTGSSSSSQFTFGVQPGASTGDGGAGGKMPSAPSGGFTFGTSANAPGASTGDGGAGGKMPSAPSGGFTFGTSATAAPAPPATSETSAAPGSGFVFRASSQSASSGTTPGSISSTSAGGFGFGAGTGGSGAKAASSGFESTFGKPSQPAASGGMSGTAAPAVPTGFTFGVPSGVAPAPSSATSSSSTGFGAFFGSTSHPSSSAAERGTTTSTTSGGFSFGAPSDVASASGFSFGAPSQTTTNGATSGTRGATASGASGGFTFGAPSGAAPAPSLVSTKFLFGTSSQSEASLGASGNVGKATTTASGAFVFGAPPSAPSPSPGEASSGPSGSRSLFAASSQPVGNGERRNVTTASGGFAFVAPPNADPTRSLSAVSGRSEDASGGGDKGAAFVFKSGASATAGGSRGTAGQQFNFTTSSVKFTPMGTGGTSQAPSPFASGSPAAAASGPGAKNSGQPPSVFGSGGGFSSRERFGSGGGFGGFGAGGGTSSGQPS